MVDRPVVQEKLAHILKHDYIDLDLRSIHEAWHSRLPEIERFCLAIKRYARL